MNVLEMETVELNIQLIIRAPNQNIEDQVVDCNVNWTIKQLKVLLSKVYPRRPEVQDQKLIYSGQLLHDNLYLKEIFDNEDGQVSVHILHLVCNSLKSNLEEPDVLEPNINETISSDIPVASSEPVQNEPSSSPIQAYGYLRQRFIHGNHSHSLSFPPFPTVATSSNVQFSPDLIMTQQFALMQQMYANYVAQYMRRAQISQSTTASETSTAISPQPNVNTSEIQQNAVQNNIHRRQQGNPNIRMNAHGGLVLEDEDDGNRDWLDYFYLICRGIVLLLVVYFYSSPERFMLVLSLAFLVYLYQEVWLARRQRNDRPFPSQQPRPNERNQAEELLNNSDETTHPNNDFTEADIQGAREVESVMDGDEPLHARNSQVNHITGTAWAFVSSFFSSLLPEQPAAPVNIN